jgi:hypothetical protein
MSEYIPDCWVMVKITGKGNPPVYKILASWYGGYAKGDSWKLNSGIVKIEEDGQTYLFHGYSGSVYRCHKEGYRMSGYTRGVCASFEKQAEESEDIDFELMPDDTNFMEIDYVSN